MVTRLHIAHRRQHPHSGVRTLVSPFLHRKHRLLDLVIGAPFDAACIPPAQRINAKLLAPPVNIEGFRPGASSQIVLCLTHGVLSEEGSSYFASSRLRAMQLSFDTRQRPAAYAAGSGDCCSTQRLAMLIPLSAAPIIPRKPWSVPMMYRPSMPVAPVRSFFGLP